MYKIHGFRKIFLVAAPCVLLAMGGCVSKVNVGGYVNDVDIGEQIAIGKTTRDMVLARLGSPSAQSSFGSDTWYYISDRMETVAFFESEIVKQNVLRIEFDEAGVVQSISQLDENDRLQFDLVERTTPTEGHSLGIAEQLLGNIGRFNRDGTERPGVGRGGGAPGRGGF